MAWGVGITTGWGETEVFMEVSSRRLALEQHRHPPARGLLSLISLLRAFPLTGINRNQSAHVHDARASCVCHNRACDAWRDVVCGRHGAMRRARGRLVARAWWQDVR